MHVSGNRSMKQTNRLTAAVLLCLSVAVTALPALARDHGPSAGSPAGGDTAQAARSELSNRVENWRLAYNSSDLQKLATFYADGARYVSPHVPDLMITGRKAILSNFERGVAGGGHIDSIVVLSADTSCDLATLVCRYDATNNGVKVSGRNVLVMRRTEGLWLITTHASIVRD